MNNSSRKPLIEERGTIRPTHFVVIHHRKYKSGESEYSLIGSYKNEEGARECALKYHIPFDFSQDSITIVENIVYVCETQDSYKNMLPKNQLLVKYQCNMNGKIY